MSAKKKGTKKKATKKKAAKKKTPSQAVTVKEAAALLSVDDKTIRRWIKKGCPSSKRKPKGKGGPARVFVDPVGLVKWCRDNAIDLPDGSKGGDAPPPDPSAAGQDPDRNKTGIVGALARMRSVERVAYSAYLRSVHDKESPAIVRAKQRLFVDAVEALRKAEKELPGILEGRGESIPLQTAIDEQLKINMAIKRDLLTLPRKLTPTLAAMSDEIDPGKVEDILAREIDDLLRHLASGQTLSEIDSGSVPAAGEIDG